MITMPISYCIKKEASQNQKVMLAMALTSNDRAAVRNNTTMKEINEHPQLHKGSWRYLKIHHAILPLLICVQSALSLLVPTTQAFQHPPSALITRRSKTSQEENYSLYTRLYSSDSERAVQELMAEFDPILLYVSRLLPPATAKEAGALYAWCRRLDEICDDVEATDMAVTQQKLDDWENRLDALWTGNPADDLDAALTECVTTNDLSQVPFRDMIAGMRADAVDNRRVATMEELEEYAYQVAGTVGLMLLPLLKAPPEAKEPAIALGKAIQLINILRDASPDVELGRIYLPQDLLRAQNVLEEDVMARNSSKRYRVVTKEVSERAGRLLEEAEEGKTTLPGLGPLLVQIIVELYKGYLEELKRRDYDNLSAAGERVKISTTRKLVASLTAISKVLTS